MYVREQARLEGDSGSASPKGPNHIETSRGPLQFKPIFNLHENCTHEIITKKTIHLRSPSNSNTVTSAERSSSKLKLIKTYLHSKMEQSRLTNLAILSIENAEAKILDISELIRKFASANVVREARF